MATPLASGVVVCSVCGQPLNAKGDCPACLLRTGLEETLVETKPSALVFGDFEVEQGADGSYWELGHGAMGVTYLAVDKVLRRRVALKVISRTSVMQYKSGIARNLKEITQQLGVNNVVEGSVSRASNKVRVSVQLIARLADHRGFDAREFLRSFCRSVAAIR